MKVDYKDEQKRARAALTVARVIYMPKDNPFERGRPLDLGIKAYKRDNKFMKGSLIRALKEDLWRQSTSSTR